MNTRRATGAVTTVAVVLLGAVVVSAEPAEVMLTDGSVLRGDVEQTEAGVRLTNLAGTLEVPDARIDRVMPVETPADLAAAAEMRRAGLGATDFRGHFALAAWLFDHGADDLAAKQARRALAIDPQDAHAQALLSAAERGLAAVTSREAFAPLARLTPPPPEDELAAEPVEEPGPAGDQPPPAITLTDEEINRVKFAEMTSAGGSDLRLRARRGGATLEATQEQIAAALLQIDPDGHLLQDYNVADVAEKVLILREHTGLRFADAIMIVGDPQPMAEFRTEVLPLVRQGCLGMGCHNTTGPAAVFRLPRGAPTAEPIAYATFVTLDELETADGPLIDRAAPAESPLLGYLLPADVSPVPHPPLERGRQITPVLEGVDDPRYETLREWIDSLASPDDELETEDTTP